MWEEEIHVRRAGIVFLYIYKFYLFFVLDLLVAKLVVQIKSWFGGFGNEKKERKGLTYVKRFDLSVSICIWNAMHAWHNLRAHAPQTQQTQTHAYPPVYIIRGGVSSVVRAPDSWPKGRGYESLLERRENFLLQGQLSVLTLFRYPFHPRVTAVARKWPRSFCQKRRWQQFLVAPAMPGL